jgi:DNA-binding MarR family transcriptional regulator
MLSSVNADGFRIGALVSIPRAAISKRVRERSGDEGFGDVTPAQEVAMQTLAPGGMRLTQLAARAGMAKQSMGYLVEQLERAGYLERVPDPGDARAKLIRRTERGWAYNRVASEVVAELEHEWAELIGGDSFRELKGHLARLAEALGAEFRGSAAEATNRE